MREKAFEFILLKGLCEWTPLHMMCIFHTGADKVLVYCYLPCRGKNWWSCYTTSNLMEANLARKEKIEKIRFVDLERQKTNWRYVCSAEGNEAIDRDDLFVWDDRDNRCHGKKLRKTRC